MGKLALIMVIGLSLTVGIVGFTLNRSKTNLVENVSGFAKYTNSRNAARTGVNMMLRKMDRSDTSLLNPMYRLQTSKFITNFQSSLCTVTIKLTNPPALDTVDLRSAARFMDSIYVMNLRLRRSPVPFPEVREAVGLRVPNVKFDMSGSPVIDGRNHKMDGSLVLPADTSYRPGVGVLTAADSAPVAPFGSMIEGTPDVVVDTLISNPANYVNEYINAADLKFNSAGSPYGSNMTWGSAAAPVIVYCDGTGGGVKFTGTISGWGIMVIKGSLTLTGNFSFKGLVIAYNDTQIEQIALGTGTPTIVGGFIMGGSSGSSFTMKGNDEIRYSREALEMAKYINKLQVYRVLSWYE